MKFQANVPFKLTKLFYEKLGEQPKDKRILVIRDFFTAMHAAIENSVTFITDDKEAYELFCKNVVSNDEFGNDDTTLYVDTEINKNAWKDFIKEISSMPKFDVAIMNPPYDGNLHLKILEKVIPVADKIVNISPVRWLQDPLAKYKPKKDNLPEKYKNILSALESLTIIPASDSNNLFNIAWCDLGIYVIDKNCKNPYQISEHPGVKIVDKIQFNKSCSLRDVMCNEKGIYFCPITHAMRAVNCAHGYTILFTDNGPYAKSGWTKDAGNNYHFINLNSKNEVDNFKKYVTTKSVRFICKLVALGGMGGQNNLIPYLDYTQHWDDKRFCAYFNITGYIDDDHAEPNSEWEIILNTMKEYV